MLLRNTKVLMTWMFLATAAINMSCDEQIVPEPVQTSITSEVISISSDFAANTDANAIRAFEEVDKLRLKMREYSILTDIPDSAMYTAGTGVGTWTWSGSGIDYIYQLYEVAGRYIFNYYLLQQVDTLFTINGWEEVDGSTGYIFYDLASFGNEIITLEASRDSLNTYRIDWIFGASDNPDPFHQMKGTYLADGSGTHFQYARGQLAYEAFWNADGSGIANTHDIVGGGPTVSAVW